jgi:tryptophanyl-tRNA synthetase
MGLPLIEIKAAGPTFCKAGIDEPDGVRTMPTDPARVKRTDPGEPEKCPVWYLHKVYSDKAVQDWVMQGCRSEGIGCLDCKKRLIEEIKKEQAPIIERPKEYEENPDLVRNIINEGCDAAREIAHETMGEVKQVVGLDYL